AIVVGKRFFDRTVPFSSRFGRGFSNFWLKVQTGCSLKDTQSGFRAYPVAVLEWLKLRERRFSFEIEVLVRAAWAGIALKDVDISVHYPAPEARISHFHPLMDNVALTLLNTRLTIRAILPIPQRSFIAERDGSEKLSILHPIDSLKGLLGRNISPKQLALSAGLGIFLGSLPLIACQTLTILMTASYFRLSKLAALGTSQLCIPPIVPALCIELGYFVRHGRFLTEISFRTLGYQGLERIFEWVIGALILGPVIGALTGGIVYVTTLQLKKTMAHTGSRDVLKAKDGRQWTSRSVGSKLQHNIFYTIIRLGGHKAAYAVLNCVALYYTLLRPAIRKKADPYLTRRFKTGNPFKKLLNAHRIYVGLGKALIDRATLGIKGIEHMRIECGDRGVLKDLISEGRGLVLLTAHVGCWQAAMSALHSLNTPVSLLLHREEGDVDLHYFEHTRGPAPFRIIDPEGYLGGVLEMMNVLKRGEVLSIMGDRVFGDVKSTLSVDFLGSPVRVPFSPFKLGSATGAPIAVMFSHKSGPDSYELTVEGIIRVPHERGRPEKAFLPYAAQFALCLESYVERHPYQFFNFFDMWKEN
ncbi:MAG: putative acyltransferase, superfamily, partial [Deltaproteobacteria bacterium]|nr:putative acyltransferase, superfamily [Deltaproteobacteria bacterium]